MKNISKNKSCIGCIAWHGILYFSKSLRSPEEFMKNPHIKIPPKSPPTNIQSLCIFKKSKIYSEIILLRFRPVPARFAPPATVHALGPLDPSRLGILAKRRLFFEFAQSGNDASSLSCHCQVGPACQFHPLPCTGRPQSHRHLASLHPITPHRSASSIETPIKAPYSLALIPPLESPLAPSPTINGLNCKSSAVTHRHLHPEQPRPPIKGEHHPRVSPHPSPPLFSSLHA
jgi:hypothetical protein